MEAAITTKPKVANTKDAIVITSLSRPTIYRMIKTGTFPKPVNLGLRRIGWPLNVLEDWVSSCLET
jgi:prophage regulatory protein